jgi:hypothetical protein
MPEKLGRDDLLKFYPNQQKQSKNITAAFGPENPLLQLRTLKISDFERF